MYKTFKSASFIVGRGSIDYLKEMKNKRIFLVHGGDKILSQERRQQLESLIHSAGSKSFFSSPILREPYFSDVQLISGEMASFMPDRLVAIGGGAVIDAAKLALMIYENPKLTKEELTQPYQIPDLGKKALLTAVPTSSGTGAETTSAAVFTDDATKRKSLALGDGLIPHTAILDADFTDTMPAEVAAYTGMDALTHALEAAVCRASNPLGVSLAITAALDILENIEEACLEDADPQLKKNAREKCHVAASLAGVAITNACTGLVHALDQPGGYFGLAHGKTCAILLPHTLSYLGAFPPLVTVARRLGLSGSSDKALLESLVQRIKDLSLRLNLAQNFSKAGIDEKAYMAQVKSFSFSAKKAMATQLSPRLPSLDDLEDLLKKAD